MSCKESLRVLGGVLAGLAIGIVLLVAGAHWWLSRYLHGEAFRKLISAKTSAALRVEGDYLPLHWSGMTVYSDGFHARGLPGAPLKELRVDQIRADLEVSGLLRNEWRISGLDVQRLAAKIAPSSPVAASGTSASGSSARVELKPLRIHDANIEWTSGSGSGSVRRAQMAVKFGDGAWEVSTSSGELSFGELQAVRIERANIRFQRDTAFVSDGLVRLADGAKVAVNGQIGLASTVESDLVLRHDDAPVERWLPADWRGRLIGKARGESKVRGRLGEMDGMTAEGSIELTGGKLEALPVLNRLALFTGSEQFRQLQLHKARAEYTWTPTRLTLQRLAMESTGLLRIEGACVVEKGVLAGEFDVGVASATLRWLPGAQGRVFTVERDGYRWTKVRLQGPTNDIQEDLSSRLVAAAGTEVIEDTKGIVQKGAETLIGIFQKLTQ
ncbi:MAG: hypothetical protein FJ395_05040 [Verrucomicrobia bacterium]|nr:hypothetical protein [Verrucomicrobiota bacterium]